MNLAELSEAISLPDRYARRDRLEIPVVREEDRVIVLRRFGDDWIGSVRGQHVAEPGNGMSPRLEEFAGRFGHVIICKEPQL